MASWSSGSFSTLIEFAIAENFCASSEELSPDVVLGILDIVVLPVVTVIPVRLSSLFCDAALRDSSLTMACNL